MYDAIVQQAKYAVASMVSSSAVAMGSGITKIINETNGISPIEMNLAHIHRQGLRDEKLDPNYALPKVKGPGQNGTGKPMHL